MVTQRRTAKKQILSLLERPSLSEIFDGLEAYPLKVIANPLFSAICSSNEQIRWNGVFAFGFFASKLAVIDLEQVRIVMRRFLWSLNDESGGIGWGAPESMAEIMYQLQPMRDEYLHMLLSYIQEDGGELCQDGNFIELPQLQRGVLWGIMRLSEKYPDEILARIDPEHFEHYLDSPDYHVIALTIHCLRWLGVANFREKIASFQSSPAIVQIRNTHEFVEESLGDIARCFLAGSAYGES